jgi:hypothetical protein
MQLPLFALWVLPLFLALIALEVFWFRRARGWRQRLAYAFGAPGWRPDGAGLTAAAIREAARRAA